jgi:DtxR family Mn-dependent transcriptional regulator
MPNRSTEDYLKTICMLQEHTERVSTSALAARLQVADASITGMIKKLSRRGLVQYEPYRGVHLTPAGRKIAMKIVRRHRLWEMFLAEYLGFSWDQIHDEAERLEHVTSDELERRLDRLLGCPRRDPHGDPIPSTSGRVTEHHDALLAEAVPGSVVVVARVNNAHADLLKYVSRLGIGLRTRMRVKENNAWDGSMTVTIAGRERFISGMLAQHIFVHTV